MRLLKSLAVYEPSMKVIIVDDGSKVSPSYYYKFSSILPQGYMFIKNERNMGFAHTVNEGLRYAYNREYDFAVLLNNDIELIMPFLKRMKDCFKLFPRLHLWGPRLLYPHGIIQSAGYEVNSEGAVNEFDKNQMSLVDPGNSLEPRFVMGVTGALMGMRLSMCNKVGFFNENYFLAYEDVDYCLNSWMNGLWTMIDGHVDALHDESATRGKGMNEVELKSLTLFRQRLSDDFSIPRIKLSIMGANKIMREYQRDGLQKEPKETNE